MFRKIVGGGDDRINSCELDNWMRLLVESKISIKLRGLMI